MTSSLAAKFMQKIKQTNQTHIQKLVKNIKKIQNQETTENSSKGIQNKIISPETQSTKEKKLVVKVFKKQKLTEPNADSRLKKTEEKRKELLLQLKEIDNKINSFKTQKQKDNKQILRNSRQINQQQIIEKTEKALELVKKMNMERKQREERKRLENLQARREIERSIEKIEQMKKEKELEILEKRKMIELKITKSRQNRTILKHLNKESNKLLVDMNRIPDIFDFTQVHEDVRLPTIQTKKYPKTHFLKTIQEQEKAKKLQEDIKERQKLLVNEKRKSYNFIVKREPINHKISEHKLYKYNKNKSKDYLLQKYIRKYTDSI